MNTQCPNCGSNGRIARLELHNLYRCTNRECRLEYFITPKGCRICNEAIDDEYEYCSFHAAYYGEERPAPDNVRCAVCLHPAADDSTYCPRHRDQFDQEHDEYLQRFEEELRAQHTED